MKTLNAFGIFVGSITTYIVMAACGAAEAHRHSSTQSGGRGGSAGTVTRNGGAGGEDASLFDALMDPVADADAQNESGTRLRARYLVGEDGARQFVGWHDSQLNVNCSFLPATDGKTRCLPNTTVLPASGAFTDTSCASPAFGGYLSCVAVPDYGAVPDVNVCPMVFKIYRLAPYSGTLYTGACSTWKTVVASDNYFDGTLVDPATFVAAAEQVE